IHGNIYASERVVLLSTCRLYGDIITPKLFIEEGVLFEGKCTVNP
ncbi:MAG TPA: polymer-forming cytoskeletal protein, partial [Leptospiraceae bacterium]|nr:polymer-forming cytoskeletal protein [Leptospiraceae bacterium]